MCGIAGIVATTRCGLTTGAACCMRDVLAHRGPMGPGVRRRTRRARPPPPEHRRPRRRRPAAGQRGRVDPRLQRRDLQPRRPAAAPRSGRAPLSHAVGHRDDRPRLRTVGRRLRPAVPRHVRVRDLGRAAAASAARPRSPRRQAPLLGLDGRPALRVRDQGDPRERPDRGARQRIGPARSAGDPRHGRRGDAVPRHPQADARPRSRWRTGTCSRRATGRPVGAGAGGDREGPRRRDRRRFARCSTSPSGCG